MTDGIDLPSIQSAAVLAYGVRVDGVREPDGLAEQRARLDGLERVALAVEAADVDLVVNRLTSRFERRHDTDCGVVIGEPDVGAGVRLQDGPGHLVSLFGGELLDRLVGNDLDARAAGLRAVDSALATRDQHLGDLVIVEDHDLGLAAEILLDPLAGLIALGATRLVLVGDDLQRRRAGDREDDADARVDHLLQRGSLALLVLDLGDYGSHSGLLELAELSEVLRDVGFPLRRRELHTTVLDGLLDVLAEVVEVRRAGREVGGDLRRKSRVTAGRHVRVVGLEIGTRGAVRRELGLLGGTRVAAATVFLVVVTTRGEDAGEDREATGDRARPRESGAARDDRFVGTSAVVPSVTALV